MVENPVGVVVPESAEYPRTPAVMDIAGFSAHVEELGYSSVWVTEGWSENVVVRLTEMAQATDGIRIGSAIMNVFSRSPAILAATGAGLTRVSDGRFVMGLGPSRAAQIENLHGLEYSRPVRRLHEVAEMINAYVEAPRTVSHNGELITVDGYPGFDMSGVPLFNAALGPANRRATGRVFDGWLPHNIPLSNIDSSFEGIAQAARSAGRNPDDITVAPLVPTVVADNPADARDVLREHISFYVGKFDGYAAAVADQFSTETERIVECWQAGDQERAQSQISREMLRSIGVAGTPTTARERFRELAANPTIDIPIVMVPRPAGSDLSKRIVEELSPKKLS